MTRLFIVSLIALIALAQPAKAADPVITPADPAPELAKLAPAAGSEEPAKVIDNAMSQETEKTDRKMKKPVKKHKVKKHVRRTVEKKPETPAAGQ